MSLRIGRVALRLVAEGVEIPVVAATVSGAANQTSIASIQIVPTPAARRIPYRTLMHLFFHDMYALGERGLRNTAVGSEGSQQLTVRQATAPAVPESAADAAVRTAGGGETVETLEIPDDMLRYRLLFVGEVVAIQYQKTSTGWVTILQCAGPSNYWDMVAADRKGGQLFGGGRQGRAAGLTPAPFWDLLKGDTGQVFEKLTEPPASFPNLRGFSAGLIHLLEELVGVSIRRGRAGRIVVGKNQFMSMASLRLRLMQMIGVAGGGDDGPLKLLRARGFGSIWRVALRGIPRYFSYRHLINALMPYTFYETVPVLAPHYTPPTGIYANYENWAGYDTGFLRNSPQWAWIVQKADRIRAAMEELIGGVLTDIDAQASEEGVASVDEYSFAVPTIRAVLDSVAQLARDITRGVTETRSGDTVYRSVGESGNTYALALSDDDQAALATMSEDQLSAAGYRRVTEMDREAIRRLEPVAQKARSIEYTAQRLESEMGRHTTLPAIPDPTVNEHLSYIAAVADEISNYAMPPPGRRDDDADDSEPSHLYCDIFRPDVWFCAPPRSNVLFPDHGVSVNYQRMFGQEPTRLMVRMYDKWLGSDILFDKWWLAPLAPGLFRDRPVGSSGSTAAGGRLSYDLMEHELMGGIVPIFMTMSDREMYLGARAAGFGSEERRCGGNAGNEQKRYFQQVTNFLLFRTRFAARTMNVSSRFNPYAILGFPSVLVDVPPNRVATMANQLILSAAGNAMAELPEREASAILELIKKRTGQHFLGTIQQLTHTANAMGENCSTDYVLNYVREHNERLEYMGQDAIRLAQAASRGQDTQTTRRRSVAVERVLQELRVMEEVLSAESEAGMSGRAFTDGLVGRTPEVLRLPDTAGVASHDGMTEFVRSMISLYENLPLVERQALVQLPTRRTTLCFVLDAPVIRQGQRPEDPDARDEALANGTYIPGQLGPNGFEIVEAVDVTDQYRDRHRTTTARGYDAAELEQTRASLQELEADLAENERRLQGRAADRGGDSAVDRNEDDTYVENLRSQIAERREHLNAGLRTELVTLPFLGTPRDGRQRPVTTITTDRVGVPTDIRDLPQVVGALGSMDPRATGQVTLRVYRIVEDASVEGGELFDLGAEDILRPPWYSNVWTNALIGGGVYLPFYGVGSIVDPTMVLRPDGADVFGMSGQQLQAEQAALRQTVQHGTDQDGPLMSGILEGATIENAVDFLVHTYALTRQGGYDVENFIRNYTWRPVATMFDIFGSGDLQLDGDGRRAVSGVEGFHSRAFGPHSNLFGLLPYNDIQSLLGIDESDVAAAARVDVRSRRYALIQAYRMELLYLRGCAAG